MKASPIVRQIIDRDCHVSLTNRQVIRHVVSKLKNGYATFRSLSRSERRGIMRQCIARHEENRKLYQQVGRSRGWGAVVRKSE